MAEPILIWLVFRAAAPEPPVAPPPAAPRPPRTSRLGVAHHEARSWTHDPVRRGSALDRTPGAALVTRS